MFKWAYLKMIIIIKIESAMHGRERVRTLSIRRPQPHTTYPWKEEKEKIVGDKKTEHIRPTGKHCSIDRSKSITYPVHRQIYTII